MTAITLHIPPTLLDQVQALTGNPENLQIFLIQAIEHEVERQQTQSTQPSQGFWDNLQQLHAQMEAEGIEINPDEIWGDLRDKTPGREITL